MTGILNLLAGAVSSVVKDTYFNLVSLLLPGDGTNGAQNNTFLDSSTNNFTITRNGNTTQGTFSPFSQTGWSNFFDGTGDYLSLTISSTTIGSGDFTIEFWYYPTAFQNFDTMFSTTRGANGFNIGTNASASVVWYSSSAEQINSGTLTQNAWNHIAFTRTSNTLRLYVNGSQTGATPTVSTNFSATSCWIGDLATSGAEPSQGYISNLRVVTQSLASGSTYTVSTTPLTAIANTSLLTCQSNRFIDNSTNAFAITRNGDVSVQAFSPFAPTAAYSASTVGGSGYFDGTGDYLASATDAALVIGSGEFAIEWWEYRTALGNVDTSIVLGNGTYGALIGYYDSGAVRFLLSTTGSSWNIFNNAPTLSTLAANQWTHFVVTRQSTGASTSTFRVFVNGKLEIINTSGGNGTVYQPTNQIFVSGGITGSSAPIEGYMSNVRVSIGAIPTDYQTSSTTVSATTVIFTPPTAPVTTTSQGATSGNVEYLLNFTNAGITDATAKNDLETVGNAQISTTQSKFGGSSMYFDGTGDYLTSYNVGGLFTLGTVYTVEMWFYTTTVGAGNAGLINFATTISGNAGFNLYRSSAEIICNDGATGGTGPSSGASSVSANTWTHLAVVSNGTTTKLYLDGVEKGSYTGTTGSANSMTYVTIGSFNDKGSPFSGYIDDLRVTRGFARYTANFTAPTTAFPLQ